MGTAPLRIAVIGCGDIAQLHFEVIRTRADAVPVAIADNDQVLCDAAAERLPVKVYTDYIQMLNTEQPDVVHLCTPHHPHVEMAIASLERGINVLAEKPVATSTTDAHRLIGTARRSKAQLGIASGIATTRPRARCRRS